MWGMAAFMARYTAVRLTAMTFDQFSSPYSRRLSDGPSMPALLNSTSIRPYSATVAPTMRSTSAGSATSASTNDASPPPASVIPPVPAPAPAARSTTATRAPSRATSTQLARPMPEPPPVMSATFPSSRFMRPGTVLGPLIRSARPPGEAEELGPGAGVVPNEAPQGGRHRPGSRRLHAPQRHAQMLRFQDHAHAFRRQVLLQPSRHLAGDPLLHLEPMGEQLHDPGQLRQSEDPPGGDETNASHAGQRQQLMWAERLEAD